MKRLLLALALLLAPTSAWAQCNGIFPNNTVCGNNTGASNTPRAVSPSSFNITAGSLAAGGRLTLTSGQPEMTTDVVSGTNLWYAPDSGNSVPIVIGGALAYQSFVSSTTDQVGLLLTLGGSANWPADSIHDVFAYWTGSAVALATRLWDSAMLPTSPQLANNTTITTNTTPTAWTRASAAFDGTVVKNGAASATIAPANANLANCLGQDFGTPQVVASTTVTAPTDHFIMGNIGIMDIRTFASSDGTNFYTMSVNWINDSALGASYVLPNLLGNQQPYRYWLTCFDSASSGLNVFIAQVQYFTTVAPSTRRITRFNGIPVNDATITGAQINGPSTINLAQYAGTYLGTIHIDTGTNGALSALFSYGPSRTLGLWNYWNQRDVVLQAGIVADTSNSYFVTSQVFVPCESTAFSIKTIIGLPGWPIVAKAQRAVVQNTQTAITSYEYGIGLDQTTSISSTDVSTNIDTTGTLYGGAYPLDFTIPPGNYGLHNMTCLERNGRVNSTGTGVFSGYRETYLKAQFKY